MGVQSTVGVFLGLQTFWRTGPSSRCRIRKSSALGRVITAPRFPVSPPAHPAGIGQPPRPGQCPGWHCPVAVLPGSSGHFGSRPAGRWSACSPPSWPAPPRHPQSACCSSHCRRAQGEGLRTEPGWRGHQGWKNPQGPQTHRHTYTSRGGRVLGVIIQGATRNTTVSVKMGDSEKSCRGRAERTEPWPWV